MSEQGGLRTIRAANPGPLALDGTRTHIVGRERVAIIDPGPQLQEHIDAVAEAIGDGVVVSILLTHDHDDHAEAMPALAERLGARVCAAVAGSLADGDVFDTDAGALRALATPGHKADHFAFEWPAARAVFVGDLMLGGLDTALVAPPEGDLADYLASLERVRALRPAILYPAHGEPFTDPDDAIDRYVAHRTSRLESVRTALARAGARGATLDEVLLATYGRELPAHLRWAAAGAAHAYLDWLVANGEARAEGGRWHT